MLPLSGTTVLSLEQAVAAPFASRQLADLGARVIKIERPQVGDFARHYDTKARGLSSHFVWINRGKESLTLNLKREAGKEILGRLLAHADIFLQNLAPGAVERLGFGDERLRADYPELIICHVSGYGRDGPYRDKKAYDLLIQAEAGLLSVTGKPGDPAKVGIAVADIAAGMYAYSGILAALLARQRSGEGSVIEVSMLEALGEWMGFPMYHSLGGTAPSPFGAAHATIAPYGPFATGDGHVVMMGIQNEREWASFCEIVLQQPDLATAARFAGNTLRVENRAELRALISEAFSELTRDEIANRLELAHIANAEMRTMQGFMAHPQLAARDRWREVNSPLGPLPALLPPATMSGVEAAMEPIPALGQHTELVLAEIGYERSQIEELRRTEVI
jgi:itaconate CoA-transferase